MAKKSLIDYAILLQKNYVPNWHHELIAEKLQEVADHKIRKLMIFMPPRHGKSELASIKFPAWYLGRHPEKRVMSCSHTAQLAEEFGRNTRNTVDNEVHGMIFPDSKLQRGSKAVDNWKVSERGGYIGTGIGGSITGKGADILIVDDPLKDAEEAESPLIRKKIYDWYTSTAYTRLEKNGAVIIIMTRWHDDDLAGRLLEQEGERGYIKDKKTNKWIKFDGENGLNSEFGKWTVLKFPAIAEKDEHFRRRGEPLWPGKYDLEALEDKKASVGLKVWGAEYQQDPVNEEGAEFKKEWFKIWTQLPKNVKYVTTVDLAIGQKESADDTVVMTTCIDVHENIYIVEYKNWHATPTDTINEIYRQQKLYNSIVGIESVGYQAALLHYIQLEGRKRGKYLQVEAIRTNTNKEAKIRGLIPYYNNGLLFHANGMQELEEQLKRFPSGKHDDIIDALAMSLQLLRRPQAFSLSSAAGSSRILNNIKYAKDGKPYI